MSCGPGCRTCVPARLTCAASSMPWTPSSPIRRPTSNSPMTWKDSSPSCEPAAVAPVSQSASASCGSSSKTSSSARRRSPSGTASPPAETAHPCASKTPKPIRRVTIARVIHCVGGVTSPVLANLFLHYAFDAWMAREFPAVPFERYVDDAVVHCESEAQAHEVVAAIAERMEQVGLRLHPGKTKVVYCKDGKRRGSYEHTSFTFLGFTFQQRRVRDKNGRQFSSVNPAISTDALKSRGGEVRSWRLPLPPSHTFAQLARIINPIVRGWMQYYGAFDRSALYPLLARINAYLVRWIRQKYKRLQARKKAMKCWQGITERYPSMFAHWRWVPSVPRIW